MQERLQKILSARGICSRRKAEEYILAGLVKVNGKTSTLGQKADPAVDKITVEGKVIKDRKEMLYYVMNKPVGVETTNVERLSTKPKKPTQVGRQSTSVTPAPRSSKSEVGSAPSIRDILPKALQGKVFPVGRLDKESSGLLLLTNDGVLAFRLTHPKFQHDKEYEVILDRPVDALAIKKLEEGFILDGSRTKPLEIRKIRSTAIRITLTEGKNRQIRRMCQHVGYTVKELKRVRITSLEDARLPVGLTRALKKEEKSALLQSVGLEA